MRPLYDGVLGNALCSIMAFFFFSSRRRHTRFSRDWSSDVCSSDLVSRALRMMIEPLYVRGRSPLHRLPAALQLAALVAAGAGLFLVRDPRLLGVAAAVAGLLVWSTGAGAAAWCRPTRGPPWVLAAIGLFAGLFQGWLHALGVLLRIVALVGLALAVTLSTRSSDLIAVCERALLPLQRLGLLDAGKVALALALALRFVPEIWRHFQE